jgi:hypothetical protein
LVGTRQDLRAEFANRRTPECCRLLPDGLGDLKEGERREAAELSSDLHVHHIGEVGRPDDGQVARGGAVAQDAQRLIGG